MRYLLYIAKWDKCSHELQEAVEVIAAEYERQKATTKVVAEKTPPPSWGIEMLQNIIAFRCQTKMLPFEKETCHH
jgi:hypothetical protein